MTNRTVRDVMTTEVRTVHPGSSVKAVAEQFDLGRISAVPVVNEERHVLGVISETDLLHKITYQDDADGRPRLLRRHRADRAKADGMTAAELMTTPPVTVGPGASLTEAAGLMERTAVKRLPVIDESGALVGIVSRGDLIRVFTRSDADILREVEREIFLRVLMLPPGMASAEVTDGVVTIRGALARECETEVAGDLVRRVDGVVGVDNQLTYRLDDTTYRAIRDADAPRGVFY
ncbi:CBS domain-containing protein [Cryptosporangium arvum]|uniref:Putative signal-transduction protein containing cAMP-binding and CBS domains n=1 Tax=Cryptosporangium arvum DSM 44712 TaxID=927661 RepID=A0A010YQH9_9ACTN|nr:CBS domain-containing protein [Cryptosporangium arvum]EXG82450.1 putative signal-transduction protein containing cAMP-binding and CBS domains [Cryptosporangium arvum DSM 44712]